MKVRFYKNSDYKNLISLYKTSDEFLVDEVTDSLENISRKIEKDPESIIIAEENNEFVGSVSLIEDGRVALLFRLIAKNDEVLKELLNKAEEVLKNRGYKEVHNIAPLENQKAIDQRLSVGFKQGKNYTWFWKKINEK